MMLAWAIDADHCIYTAIHHPYPYLIEHRGTYTISQTYLMQMTANIRRLSIQGVRNRPDLPSSLQCS